MMQSLSENTKAILLLTAPLIVGRSSEGPKLLSPGEYKALAQHLHELGQQPSDLLGPSSEDILTSSASLVDSGRVKRLLSRGLQLSQAIQRWETRAIWVVSRADPHYPIRLKNRLKWQAPAVLYGCGELAQLNCGGLAVVGSRNADDELLQYSMEVGQLSARSNKSVISGGAKGIDQAAMRGALEAGGRVCGVLADSLEKRAMTRDHRDMIVSDQLTLVSPFDPSAGFNAGNAMQRNKVVYALADAALVVSSDVNKGGTWAGAIEQLNKFKQVPVYVRVEGSPSPGLDALRQHGALAWPDPSSIQELEDLLNAPAPSPAQPGLALFAEKASPTTTSTTDLVVPSHTLEDDGPNEDDSAANADLSSGVVIHNAAGKLFGMVTGLIVDIAQRPVKDADVADALQVSKSQARAWLERLVDEHVLERRKGPTRYVTTHRKLL